MVEGDISLKIHDTFLVPYDKLVILIDRPLTKEEIKKGQEAWVNKAISFHEHFLRILDQIDEKTQGRKQEHTGGHNGNRERKQDGTEVGDKRNDSGWHE